MLHRKYTRAEKDVNLGKKDGSAKLRRCNNERDSPNVDTLIKRVEDKPHRKLSNSNLVYKTNKKSTVLIKENEEHTRTLDLILNFEWRKKKSNSYVSAYFTDSDLNKRKMFHESNSSKAVNTLNVELIEDKAQRNNFRLKNKNYFLNITKGKKGKVEIGNGKKELEELFRATNTDFKSFCQEDDIFKDLDRYFKTAKNRNKRKGCFYHLTNDVTGEKTTVLSPEKKCSSINLLLYKQGNYKRNKFKNGIGNFDEKENNVNNCTFNNNSNENSLSKSCPQKKNLNEYNILQCKTKKNKSKHTLIDERGRIGLKNYYRNDERISTTSEKDSLGSSKTRSSAKSKNLTEDISLNAYCGQLKHTFYDNYIHLSPERLESGKKKISKNSTSNKKSHSNEECDKFIQLSSNSSILDYSISRRKQGSISQSLTDESSELPSDCTIVNYNLARKSSKNYQTLRKPSCEILMNRIKNKKSEKIFDYKYFLKDIASKKSSSNKQSEHNNFEETCRNYIIDRKLRKYKVRNTRTESEFIPTSRKYSVVASKVCRPNSIEKDILLKPFDDGASNPSRLYNYHMPFNLKMIESHKFEFNEDNLTLSEVLNIDESILKSKQSNDVSLKLSIPNMYVIKETDNDYSLNKSRGNERTNHRNTSDFGNYHLPRKEVNNKIKKKRNLNFVDEHFQGSVMECKNILEENYKINKSYKNPDFRKPDTEIVIRDKEIKKNRGIQMNKEINNDQFLNETILIYKPQDKNYEKNKKIYSNNIEVLFPVKPNRRFSCSHTTLTNRSLTSTCSSKVRFCKSDISQNLEKTNAAKIIPSKKRVIIDESRNCSINKCAQKDFSIDDRLTSSPVTDTSCNKNSTPKTCDQVLSKCSDLLNSSKFKSEIEKIVNKYLEKKVIINWLGHNKFNILVFAEDKVLKNNPQKIIETLQNKHMKGLMRNFKSCSYKLHKFQASCKSLMKNEQTQKNDNCAKVEVGNCSKQEDKIPYELLLCENCLECKNFLNANKIKSLPIFNLSKLKIQKRSVTYYSKLSSHSIKMMHKPKNIKKTEKNKIVFNKNKCSKSNDKQKNNLGKKEENSGKVIQKQESLKLIKELNEFKNLLTEVEKKQDSILSFLNMDPCGLLFTFPSSSSMLKKCNQIKRLKIPFRRFSEKVLNIKEIKSNNK